MEQYWVMLHVRLFRSLLLKWLHWAKISIGIPSKSADISDTVFKY
jgi:hypothetical protein